MTPGMDVGTVDVRTAEWKVGQDPVVVDADEETLEQQLFKKTGLPVTVGDSPDRHGSNVDEDKQIDSPVPVVMSRADLIEKAKVVLQHPDLVGAQQREELVLDILAGQSPEELRQSDPEIYELYSEILQQHSSETAKNDISSSVESTTLVLDQQLQRVFTFPDEFDANQLNTLVEEGLSHPDEKIQEQARKLQEMLAADALANVRNVAGLAEAFDIPLQEIPVGVDLPEIDAALIGSVHKLDADTLEAVVDSASNSSDSTSLSETEAGSEQVLTWRSIATLIALIAADQLIFKGQGAVIITTFADASSRLVRLKNGDFSGFAREPAVRQMQDLMANMPSDKLFKYLDDKTQQELVQTLSQFDPSFRRRLMGGESLKILSLTKLGDAEKTRLFRKLTPEQQKELDIADLNPNKSATA